MNQEHTADTSTTTPARAGRWAGVDSSWTEHAVCVVDDTGAVVERLTVKHTAAGLARLVTALHGHGVNGVAIERGAPVRTWSPPGSRPTTSCALTC